MITGRYECEENIAEVLRELQRVLPSQEKGVTIQLKTEGDYTKGFTLVFDKEKEEAFIRYENKSALCRAFLYLHASDLKKSFSVQQECAFSDFGIMLDCSRNAVPTVDALKRYLCYAALMGYQYVGLYTEDTIEVEQEPYFGYLRGRWTAKEIQEADVFAHLLGMELRPYVQTLAHLNQALRHKEYAAITDADDILLMEDPRTEELLDHLLGSVSKMYQSKVVNLGMDEAEMVGLGRYLQRHGYQERQGLMRKHLDRVLAICEKYGLYPQIWSDMFFKLAFGGSYYLEGEVKEEEVQEKLKDIAIPEKLDLVYWDYYHLQKEDYDRMTRAHKILTPNTVFAGGVWKWQGFAPNNRFSMKIGYQALKSCCENGIQKVVLTSWGDNGAEADMFSVLPSLFMDAQYAWKQGREEAISQEDNQLFTAMTGYTMEEFLKLDDVNPYIYDGTGHNNACKFFLYNDPLLGICDSLVKEGTAQCYRKATEELQKLSERDSVFSYLFETEALLSKVLESKSDLGVRLKQAYDKKEDTALHKIEEELPELISGIEQFYQQFRKQWMRNNRSFGFEVQTIRIGGLKQRLMDLQMILSEYIDRKTDTIPELEEEHLPFDLLDGEVDTMEFNYWTRNVTTSAMCW